MPRMTDDAKKLRGSTACVAAIGLAVACGEANPESFRIRSAGDKASSSCGGIDPTADAATRDQAFEVAPYQDIVSASVTRIGDRFVVEMGVAGPLPDSPLLDRGVHLLDWTFRFDTDPSSTPKGFPWAAGDHIHG